MIVARISCGCGCGPDNDYYVSSVKQNTKLSYFILNILFARQQTITRSLNSVCLCPATRGKPNQSHQQNIIHKQPNPLPDLPTISPPSIIHHPSFIIHQPSTIINHHHHHHQGQGNADSYHDWDNRLSNPIPTHQG